MDGQTPLAGLSEKEDGMQNEAHTRPKRYLYGRDVVYCPWTCLDETVLSDGSCSGCNRDLDLDAVFGKMGVVFQSYPVGREIASLVTRSARIHLRKGA